MSPAGAPSAPDQGQKHGFHEPTLGEVVKRLDDPEYLFVIGIAIVLSGLAGLAWARGTPDLRFVVTVIALLALTVIVVSFVKFKLVRVEQRQDVQQSEIEAVRAALRGILTKHEFGPLKGLDGPGPVEIRKDANLIKYLHRLDGLDFIQPNAGFGLYDVEKKPDGELFDLRHYFYITDAGRDHMRILTFLKILKSDVDWTDPHPFQ